MVPTSFCIFTVPPRTDPEAAPADLQQKLSQP